MRIELENIGMFDKASVRIDGLTVIAGENDTGKSTVGKILFCIIKAISKFEDDFQESRRSEIDGKIEEIFFKLRKHFIDIDGDDSFKDYIRDQENNNKKIMIILDRMKRHIIQQPKGIRYFQDELKVYIKQNYDKEEVDILFKDLLAIVNKPIDKQKSLQNTLAKVFHSEFDSSILKFDCENGYIKLYENKLLLLNISINKKNKIELLNEVQKIELKEATFIETPLILNNKDILLKSQTGLNMSKGTSRQLGVPYTTLHTKDLFDKVKERFFEFTDEASESQIRSKISSIINGEIIYDSKKEDFVYMKKDGQEVLIKNTATGIKTFGIIDLLLKNDFINKTSILILDEPEIHLHPKWQLKYAEIINILVKNGIIILIASHSPYMIEALKRYSDREGLKDKSRFYLSENGHIEDKNKLGKIFEVLSEPFEEFNKMDREILKDE